MSEHKTLRRQESPAHLCHLYGWGVGTVLAGDEGYGVTKIQITAIGEKSILAKEIEHDGKPIKRDEHTWVLHCREWVRVDD